MITRRTLLSYAAAVGSVAVTTRAFATRWFGGHAETVNKLTTQLQGRLYLRGEAGYEELRLGSVWNARKPARYPPAIVMAESESDVVAAVQLAKAKGWQVGVRSTGHSWVAPHTRDNALLINLSRIQDIAVDTESNVVSVTPAVQGQVLGKALRDKQLMFPTGHCYGVGLGGYVLSGGHGWNSRLWGPACASLRALDVITAEGALIHADKDHNTDYFWAARGAGPGFFGVATRFYLQAHALPTVMRLSRYEFSLDVLEELFTWVRTNMETFPRILEVLIQGSAPDGTPRLKITAVALGYSDQEVADALGIIDSAPFINKATSKALGIHVVLPAQEESPTAQEPHGARIAMDGTWTSAPAAALIPRLRELFSSYPTAKSFVMWQSWGPVQKLDDMAYSIQADVYISCGAVYEDAADDAKCDAWVNGNMRRLEDLSAGSMMNDDNMIGRKSRYLSDDASRRLDVLRARHDPHGLFVSFLKS
jgi:FAD/FMN-containing dehydrogenase